MSITNNNYKDPSISNITSSISSTPSTKKFQKAGNNIKQLPTQANTDERIATEGNSVFATKKSDSTSENLKLPPIELIEYGPITALVREVVNREDLPKPPEKALPYTASGNNDLIHIESTLPFIPIPADLEIESLSPYSNSLTPFELESTKPTETKARNIGLSFLERVKKLKTLKPNEISHSSIKIQEKPKISSTSFIHVRKKDEFSQGQHSISHKIDKRLGELNRLTKEQVALKFKQFNSGVSPDQITILDKKINTLEAEKVKCYGKLNTLLTDLETSDPQKYIRLYTDNNYRLSICEVNERFLGEGQCKIQANKMLKILEQIKKDSLSEGTLDQLSEEDSNAYLARLSDLSIRIKDDRLSWGTRTIQPGMEVSDEISRVLKHMELNKFTVEESIKLPITLSIKPQEFQHAKKTRSSLAKNIKSAQKTLTAKLKRDSKFSLTPDSMKSIKDQTALDFFIIERQIKADLILSNADKGLVNSGINVSAISDNEQLSREISALNIEVQTGRSTKESITKKIMNLEKRFDSIHLKQFKLAAEMVLLKQNDPLRPPELDVKTWEKLDNEKIWEKELDKRSINAMPASMSGFVISPEDQAVHDLLKSVKAKAKSKGLYTSFVSTAIELKKNRRSISSVENEFKRYAVNLPTSQNKNFEDNKTRKYLKEVLEAEAKYLEAFQKEVSPDDPELIALRINYEEFKNKIKQLVETYNLPVRENFIELWEKNRN
ncbi:MAG: hypothetical protein H0X29_06875 [Parachlamydiaceae bacterium]|nr:hypothetical protein [Parachlamydiaceae bacterium]